MLALPQLERADGRPYHFMVDVVGTKGGTDRNASAHDQRTAFPHGPAPAPPRGSFKGFQFVPNQTPAGCDGSAGSLFGFRSNSGGLFGKPVIYLYPTDTIEVEVNVTLVPECESVSHDTCTARWSPLLTVAGRFAALYPLSPSSSLKEAGDKDYYQWKVKADPDGTLAEMETGLEVSYLFWEGE